MCERNSKLGVFPRFVQFFMDEQSRDGIELSLQDAVVQGAERWNQMDEFEKSMFRNDRYRFPKKKKPKAVVDPFYASLRKVTEAHLRKLGDLATAPFYFMCYEHSRHSKDCGELAIVRFTLKNGVEDYLHALFNPDQKPEEFEACTKRYRGRSKIRIVPITGTPQSEENLKLLAQDIAKFCDTGVVFANPGSFLEVREFCKRLHASNPEQKVLVTLDTSELLFELRDVNGDERDIALMRNDCRLATVAYNTTEKRYLCCNYHRIREDRQRCALANAFGVAYTFGQDQCMEKYGVTPVEGHHNSMSGYKPFGCGFIGTGVQEQWVFDNTPEWDDTPSDEW